MANKRVGAKADPRKAALVNAKKQVVKSEFHGVIYHDDPKKPNQMIVNGKRVEVALIAYKVPKKEVVHSAYVGDYLKAVGFYVQIHQLSTIFAKCRDYIKEALGSEQS